MCVQFNWKIIILAYHRQWQTYFKHHYLCVVIIHLVDNKMIFWQTSSLKLTLFLAHLWAIAITWRVSSSVCKIFFSETTELNLATIILRVSSLKIVSDVPADQPTWLPLLKVEHRGKINKTNSIKKLCKGAIASKLHWNVTICDPL